MPFFYDVVIVLYIFNKNCWRTYVKRFVRIVSFFMGREVDKFNLIIDKRV